MSDKTIVDPGWAKHYEMFPSAVPAIRKGDLLYIAGVSAVDPKTGVLHGPGSFELQMRQTMDTLKEILEAAGAGLEQVVATTGYFRDFGRDALKASEIYTEYCGPKHSAITTVEVTGLGPGGRESGVLVEVAAIADLANPKQVVDPGWQVYDMVFPCVSPAMKAGDFLYIAGCNSMDWREGVIQGPGSFELQMQKTLDAMDELLSEAGIGREGVVATTAYFTDFGRDALKAAEIYTAYGGPKHSANTAVEITGIGPGGRESGLMIEVSAIASLKHKKQVVDPGWQIYDLVFPCTSPAMKAGPHLFIAGCNAMDWRVGVIHGPGTLSLQVRKTLDGMKELLDEAGATWDDIVEMTVFLTDLGRDARATADIINEYVGLRHSALTAVEVTGMGPGGRESGLLVEISATAIMI
jgi:2-iminobutanoate/2-iminopropanoate deaminase